MNVLVTGGTGFIGSHTCVELMALGKLASISGQLSTFMQADIRDRELIFRILVEHQIEAVIHFAALKAVGESWSHPLKYFDSNISGTISLLQAMEDAGVNLLVFSSSATVYGEPDSCPIPESAATRVTNP